MPGCQVTGQQAVGGLLLGCGSVCCGCSKHASRVGNQGAGTFFRYFCFASQALRCPPSLFGLSVVCSTYVTWCVCVDALPWTSCTHGGTGGGGAVLDSSHLVSSAGMLHWCVCETCALVRGASLFPPSLSPSLPLRGHSYVSQDGIVQRGWLMDLGRDIVWAKALAGLCNTLFVNFCVCKTLTLISGVCKAPVADNSFVWCVCQTHV